MTTGTGEMLKTGDVAQMLGVSRQHVVDMCKRGELPYVLVGKHRRISSSDVDRLRRRSPLNREQEKSLWLHRALLTPLMTDPDRVLGEARSNIERWKQSQRRDGMTARHLSEWERVLDSGVDSVVDVITSSTEKSCELRQNTPFAGVVSDDVRRQVLRSFTQHWVKEHERQQAS